VGEGITGGVAGRREEVDAAEALITGVGGLYMDGFGAIRFISVASGALASRSHSS
jgi:hypothetical protein